MSRFDPKFDKKVMSIPSYAFVFYVLLVSLHLSGSVVPDIETLYPKDTLIDPGPLFPLGNPRLSQLSNLSLLNPNVTPTFR